jgi:hypothetical protein
VWRLYTAGLWGERIRGAVSHCYPLNGNLENPRVHGVGGIISAYQNLLRNSSLKGPTNFAPVIRRTMQAAREYVLPLNSNPGNPQVHGVHGVGASISACHDLLQNSSLMLTHA